MLADDSIQVIRRCVKHVRLRVKPDGLLEIVAPWWVRSKSIEEIVRRKNSWIERVRAQFRNRILPGPSFKPDEIMLFGEPFRLVTETGLKRQALVDPLSKTIRTSRDLSTPARQVAWQRAYAKSFLTQRLRELSRQHGLPFDRVTIRAQRTRWGSCSARKNISLNWRLILTPAYVMDYVLLHELLHTRLLNHSREYWAQLSVLCPEVQRAKTWLKHKHKACL